MGMLIYNGVYLPYSKETTFRTSPVYDEVAGVDRSYTKYEISTVTIIHLEYANAILSDFQNQFSSAPALMRIVQERLEQPRKTLSYKINGVEMIPSAANVPGTVDAMNGPQPKEVNLMQLTSTSFMVSFSITAHYVYNPDLADPNAANNTNQPGNPVVYNRWTETVQIDECCYSTRTRSGVFKIRSDNVQGATADVIRSQMAVIAVPKGFIRQSSSYTISPDGLSLKYNIVDKQVGRVPPSPAFTAKGSYTETVPRGDARRFCGVRVQLKGSQSTPQNILIEAAIQIATIKLMTNGVFLMWNAVPAEFANMGRNALSVLESFDLTVDMYENIVELSMRAMSTIKRSRVMGSTIGRNGLTQTPLYNGNYTPPYQDRGVGAAFLLQAAAYYDPKLAGTILGVAPVNTNDNPVTPRVAQGGNGVSQLNRGVQPGRAGVEPE